MIRIGIVGGAGYTAGELIRILIYHSDAKIVWVHSKSHAGKPIASAHSDLEGESQLLFCDTFDFDAVDVLFLCNGHGQSNAFVQDYPQALNKTIIDLSQDFRLNNNQGFVYGLPELNKDAIAQAQHVANPGCFATAIQLALLPLAQAGMLNEVHVHAITGSTGAGQSMQESLHFSRRTNNLSVYKAFEHQHLDEIHQSLIQLMPDFDEPINFIPIKGNFTRGIFASVYTPCSLSQEAINQLYSNYYSDSPFSLYLPYAPELKQVVNTNKCLLHAHVVKGKVHIVAVLDNLLKGASGQAVQNMNIMFGLDEKTGLNLKPIAF